MSGAAGGAAIFFLTPRNRAGLMYRLISLPQVSPDAGGGLPSQERRLSGPRRQKDNGRTARQHPDILETS